MHCDMATAINCQVVYCPAEPRYTKLDGASMVVSFFLDSPALCSLKSPQNQHDLQLISIMNLHGKIHKF